MKNKILSITRNSVPYVKGLRSLPLLKSVVACILMQQLDYWFEKYPQGFYKFLEQPATNHPAYKAGDSWTEELGISADEFRTAFDQIGIRYKSKKEYDAAEDKFQGKYYCSYTDKLTRLTHYFRNHAVVDAALDSLSAIEESKGNLYNPAMPVSRNGHGHAIEAVTTKPDITENTAEPNQEITSREERGAYAPTHSSHRDANNDGRQERDLIGNKNVPEKKAPSRFKALKVSTENFDFEITPEMREWLDKNCRHDLDLELVTEKFIYHYDENPKKLMPSNWKVWMLREDDYEDEHCNGCDGCAESEGYGKADTREGREDIEGEDSFPDDEKIHVIRANPETAIVITDEGRALAKQRWPSVDVDIASEIFAAWNPDNFSQEKWIDWMEFCLFGGGDPKRLTPDDWVFWQNRV
jgi:hypothetical protein